MLYFAYGSNLHLDQMAMRCPQARPVVVAKLAGWRLVFKTHADVIPDKRCNVLGALYSITPECERALDRYEGYPRYYVKEYAEIDGRPAMFYRMAENVRTLALPSVGYLETIRDGYGHWGLPRRPLATAIRWTHRRILV